MNQENRRKYVLIAHGRHWRAHVRTNEQESDECVRVRVRPYGCKNTSRTCMHTTYDLNSTQKQPEAL